MISKKRRLNKDLFNKVFKQGSMIHSPVFVFKFIKNPENKGLFSFVAPKSVAKTAVKRNSLRRKGYNYLKNIDNPHVFGVFMYKKGTKDASLDEIRNSVDLIFSKIR